MTVIFWMGWTRLYRKPKLWCPHCLLKGPKFLDEYYEPEYSEINDYPSQLQPLEIDHFHVAPKRLCINPSSEVYSLLRNDSASSIYLQNPCKNHNFMGMMANIFIYIEGLKRIVKGESTENTAGTSIPNQVSRVSITKRCFVRQSSMKAEDLHT